MFTVIAEKYHDARTDGVCEQYRFKYRDKDGLYLIETCSFNNTSDFGCGAKKRESADNGKTWSEWEEIWDKVGTLKIGPHEENYPRNINGVWNPVHKHYVGVGMDRIFVNGHEEAFRKTWRTSEGNALCDHAYVGVRLEDGTYFDQLVKYEDGAERDPDDLLNPEYRFKNTAFPNSLVVDEKTGDIFIAMGVNMAKCCEIRGVDVNEVFPSHPHALRGLMVVRGEWNGEKYDFFPAPPVLMNDLQSSRGVDEPTITILKSGRILVVFRGSNYQNPAWNTRIEPGTPGFKWYTWSDDGGKTFVPAMPWHFDDGEVIYSSATISKFIRDERNGNLYWIGNITGHKVEANYPRWPLQIVAVDETYGTAIKDSLTVIDTIREGESERVQLSNFGTMQNRETGRLEVYLSKIGQFDGQSHWNAEPWRYQIILPE